MTEQETEKAVWGVLGRAMNMADIHGAAFIKLTRTESSYNLSIIPKEFVTISYENSCG